MRPKRVAIALFPISQEGGLATRVQHTVALLERNGISAEFFRIAYQAKKHRTGSSTLRVVAKENAGLTVAQWNLAITDGELADTMKILSGYDAVIFAHPAPHLSDSAKAARNWRHLYTIETRKLTYFSDVYYDQYYPWIMDVAGMFEPLAINEAVLEFVKAAFPTARLARAPFAYDNPQRDPEKSLDVMWATAWRGWKGIDRFVDAVPAINGSVELFGAGRDLYTLKKDAERWPAVSAKATVHGAQSPEKVEAAYRRARVACDFTGASPKYHGHVNRTTLEPMFFGCVSAVMPTLVAPHSRIPPEVVCVVDKDDVAGSLNDLLADDQRRGRIADMAYDWVNDECNDEAALSQMFG